LTEHEKPDRSADLERIAQHDLTHDVLGALDVTLYRSGSELARVFTYGKPRLAQQPLVRVQSDCYYGEVIGAVDCDCREQLRLTFNHFREDGAGMLIHLEQEGRGVGIEKKARAYALQHEQGIDTVEAYRELDFPVDAREYGIAAAILEALGIRNIALLTNNPRKVDALKGCGVSVRPVPLRAPLTDANLAYLIAKQQKLHHTLGIPEKLIAGDGAHRDDIIVIVGAAVTDHVFRLEANPKVGHARQTTNYERRAGGKGFNQAIQIARLKGNAHLVSVIGNDPDARVILDTLLREGITPHLVPSPHGVSPQTAVILPQRGAPTYIGWLGEEHRSLSSNGIGRFADTVARARAAVFTLEVSTAAMQSALDLLPPAALRVLNASPAVERGYRVDAPILDRFSIILGSADELVWLVGPPQDHRLQPAEAAAALATAYGAIVLLAEFREAPRHVDVYLPGKGLAWKASSRARIVGVSTAVGNKDAFCAALVLRLVEHIYLSQPAPVADTTPGEADAVSGGRDPVPTAGFADPLMQEILKHLQDSLFFALGVEEYVARTSAGYAAFPPRLVLEEFLASQGRELVIEQVIAPESGT
jgi:GTP cyclohydrolase II